jgi:hypothetical protein
VAIDGDHLRDRGVVAKKRLVKSIIRRKEIKERKPHLPKISCSLPRQFDGVF